ncbi:MAG: hypothetical protein WBD86_01610 [Microgenomates group bacterium]
MNKEWLSYAELPMKELVHEYLQVPLNEPVDWPLFDESLKTQLKLEDKINEDIISLVQDGRLPQQRLKRPSPMPILPLRIYFLNIRYL